MDNLCYYFMNVDWYFKFANGFFSKKDDELTLGIFILTS